MPERFYSDDLHDLYQWCHDRLTGPKRPGHYYQAIEDMMAEINRMRKEQAE